MNIEHIALNIKNPQQMAAWYRDNLGFKILQSMDISPFAHFILDASGHIMLEIFKLPNKKIPNYKSLDPAIFHIGFSVDNIEKTLNHLTKRGATVVEKLITNSAGNKVAMLKDPWGLSIQLIKRVKKLTT